MKYLVVTEKGPPSFGAYVPDLPGCFAVGKTRQIVEQRIRSAIEFHIRGLLKDGESVPQVNHGALFGLGGERGGANAVFALVSVLAAGAIVYWSLRRSTVHALDVIAYTGDPQAVESVTLDLRVSSGTYVRALAEALGGHCRTLRRTEVGPFAVADAVAPDAFEPRLLLPEADVLARVEAAAT